MAAEGGRLGAGGAGAPSPDGGRGGQLAAAERAPAGAVPRRPPARGRAEGGGSSTGRTTAPLRGADRGAETPETG